MSGAQIKELKQTCFACPSQWEIKLVDGRMVYVRYRWGYLSIRISPNVTDDIFDAVRGKEILGVQLGSGLDGEITEEDMMMYLTKALKEV